MNWQPIETAPKDGTKIVVFCPRAGVISPARWDDNKYAKKPRPYWTNYGQYVFGVQATRDDQPTHWMPILAPSEAL